MADPDPPPPADVGGDDAPVEATLKSSHPAMIKVNEELKKQIMGQIDRVDVQLRDKLEEDKRTEKHREDIGVTLYGAQQQLLKLQMALEKTSDDYSATNQARQDAEKEVEAINDKLKEAQAEVEHGERQVAKAQEELNQLNITIQQVEKYNETMKDEIAVTRRATYKTEDNITNLEQQKSVQDRLIDNVSAEIKKLSDSKAMLETQLACQQAETEQAKKTIREAAQEMENIQYEKKQLSQQLRSSMLGVQRRNTAIFDVQTQLNGIGDAGESLETEIANIQKDIRRHQDRHEELTGMLQRSEKEKQLIQGQIATINSEMDTLQEHYSLIKKSQLKEDEEMSSIQIETKAHLNELQQTEKQVQKVDREIIAIEDEIYKFHSDTKTVEKGQANTIKAMRKIAEEIKKKEIDTANLQNEIARVKVDALNTKAHNQMLEERLGTLSGELKEREKLIDQYELEIRRRHQQIEKKQLQVDGLNRIYDQKRSKIEDGEDVEASVPVEAKCKHLKKQMDEVKQDIAHMQKQWITIQTEILDVQTINDELKDKQKAEDDVQLVFTQKKKRLERATEIERKDVKTIENAIKRMRFDIVKLNTVISQSERKSESLENDNKIMETTFVAKLKDLEQKVIKMEDQIETTNAEREEILSGMIEAEREKMLWEKKCQLEKEAQDALDPTVGAAETQAMKREIHRMEVRHNQIARRQEQLVREMTRAIQKRDIIMAKYDTRFRGSKAANPKDNVAARVRELKKSIKVTMDEMHKLDGRLADHRSEKDELEDILKQHQQELNTLVEENRGLEEQYFTHNFEHLKNEHRIKSMHQIKEILESGAVPDDASLQQQEAKVQTDAQALYEIAQQFAPHHPAINNILQEFVQ